MKLNQWTLGLAAAGVVSLGSVAYAEEKPMSQVLTAVSGTQIGGYIDTSINWKPGTGDLYLPGRAYDGTGKLDGFNLNVVQLTVEKVPGQDNWAAGYRTDLLFGPDAAGYSAVLGNNNQVSSSGNFGIQQAYVDMVVPTGKGLDFKAGIFNSIVGYEVFESYKNPNYSRSFGWQLEPTSNTGLLMGYQFSEAFSMSAGMANTYMAGVNVRNELRGGPTTPYDPATTIESQKTYMGSLTLTAPESWGSLAGSTLSAGIVNGFSGNAQNTTLFYAGTTIKTGVEGLAFGVAYDYRADGLSMAQAVPAGAIYPEENSAYSLAGYLMYQASEHMKLSGRVDWSDAANGTWYWADSRNMLFAVTGTLEYSLWQNVVSRLEIRWDHCASGDKPYGGTQVYDPATGTGGPDEMNAFTVTADFVFKF
jgi:hypothetical protein